MKLYVIPYDWLILENITQKLPKNGESASFRKKMSDILQP